MSAIVQINPEGRTYALQAMPVRSCGGPRKMAIYHCSIKSISRGAGQSIVASAAYRHACMLENSRTGEVYNYSRKQGVESSDIYLPSGVNQSWAQDRGKLWNAAEKAEKRKDARLGREIVLALPAELSASQRRELIGEMACHLAERYGVAVDVAIHQPSRQGDQRNHHAHMLISSRRITSEGFAEKTRELDDHERGPAEVEHIRNEWARLANRALERAGQHVQIDHRSFRRQELKRMPSLHLGPSASAMERRGILTRLGNRNRAAQAINARAEKLGQEMSATKSLTPATEIRAGIDAARQRFFHERVTRAVAKAEAEEKERQRKQQEAERARRRQAEREALEKQYGQAVCMLVCPQSLSAARSRTEYGRYLDRLQAATPEQRAAMEKELRHAEQRYGAQELFYSWAKLVSRDTSISGRERVRDTMLKEWDRATPERREQMEQEAREYVRTHERQRSGMSMGR